MAFERTGLETFLSVPAGTLEGKPDILRLDAVQAQAILDMRLQQLANLEAKKITASEPMRDRPVIGYFRMQVIVLSDERRADAWP